MRGRGEQGEQDESVAALLVQLRDPASGRPLPRARLWSEMSVRTLGTAWNLPMCNIRGRYSISTVIRGAGFAGNQPSDGLSLQGCKKLGCSLVLIFCNN